MLAHVLLEMNCFLFLFRLCVLEFVVQSTVPCSTGFVYADEYETDIDRQALFVCHMMTHLDIGVKYVPTSASAR